jgi:hypothetical protein
MSLPRNSPRTYPKENARFYIDVVAKQQPQNGPQRKPPRCIATAHRRLETYTQTQTHTFAFIYILAEMPGVARVEISKPAIVGRLEVSPAIDPRPDRITPGTHLIGGSNDGNGVYPTTQFRL